MKKKSTFVVLIAGVLAAIAASLCCIAPLVLAALGISGAWMANLTALAPYRWIFVLITLAVLAWALYLLYWSPRVCGTKTVCDQPKGKSKIRLIFWLIAIIVLALLAFPYVGGLFLK